MRPRIMSTSQEFGNGTSNEGKAGEAFAAALNETKAGGKKTNELETVVRASSGNIILVPIEPPSSTT